jgi:spermidine dehydrogenase
MEDAVDRRVDYAALDHASHPVRIRLESTVVRVHHDAEPNLSEGVSVTYVRAGKPLRVRAKTCVMACSNAIVSYLVPDLPASQREALKLAVRKPLIWATVALKNWRAFAKLQVGIIYSPTSFYQMTVLDPGTSLGGSKTSPNPEDPATLYVGMTPNMPGLPARDQYRVARAELQTLDLEAYERNLRTQLQHMLGAGGFDAERDIAGIMINR